MLRNKISRIAALFSVMCIMIISYIFPVSAEVDTTNSSDNNIPDGAATVSSYDYKYSDYLKDNGEIVNHEKKIAIDFAAAALGHDALIGDFNGKNSVIRLESAGAGVSFKAAVKETGYYCLFIDYAGIKENDKKIIFSVSIDGKYPFFEANSIEVSRSYKNATDDFEIDDQGNELRPKQEQVEEWQVTPLYQADGGSCYPYYFFFTAGSHTIDINAVNGGVMLSKIELKQPEKIVSYEEYLKANTADKTVKDGLILQGEKASLKSSASLYPLTDRTSCATQPFSEKNTVLNSIGGTNWSNPGSWIEWEFDIETEGYYQIDMRVLQNGNIRCI